MLVDHNLAHQRTHAVAQENDGDTRVLFADDVCHLREVRHGGAQTTRTELAELGQVAAELAHPGAAMAVSEDGEVAGSVSGGCVEGAVVSEALGIIADGGPGRMVSFGYSDDEAFAVGLTCGGTIRLFIEPLDW